MKIFMVEIYFPKSFDKAFFDLLPNHRNLIVKLINKGVIQSYAFAGTYDKLWIIITNESEQKVRRLIHDFPISAYFLDVKISQLLFYEGSAIEIPQLWLN